VEIVEPGHIYRLFQLDLAPNYRPNDLLVFVNREEGTEHAGTQTQEVIRALIDRTAHCDRCLRWEGNDLIIQHLRMALVLHEARALMRKTQKGIIKPEEITLGEDGHFLLSQKGPQ